MAQMCSHLYMRRRLVDQRRTRSKNPEEIEGGPRLSRAGVIVHCGYCKDPCHNRTGCPRLNAIREAEAAEQARREAEENVQENVDIPNTPKAEENVQENRPKRRKKRTLHEHVYVLNPTRGPTCVDEYGDADIPEMLDVNTMPSYLLT
jgi:hypothetical protein